MKEYINRYGHSWSGGSTDGYQRCYVPWTYFQPAIIYYDLVYSYASYLDNGYHTNTWGSAYHNGINRYNIRYSIVQKIGNYEVSIYDESYNFYQDFADKYIWNYNYRYSSPITSHYCQFLYMFTDNTYKYYKLQDRYASVVSVLYSFGSYELEYYIYSAEKYYYRAETYAYYKYSYLFSTYYNYIAPYYAYTAPIETNPFWYYYRFV